MVILILTSLLTSFLNTECHTIKDTNKLLRDKLDGYNKNTRPTYNQSNPTIVNFSLQIIYIQEFDEVEQKLSFLALPSLSWIDEEMKWDPIDYGGLDSLISTSGLFWTPAVVLANSIGGIELISDVKQKIRFRSDGMTYYSPGQLFSSACNVDVTFYPYDTHNCYLYFTPDGYNPAEVLLKVNKRKIDKTFYIENGKWDFVDSRIKVSYFTLYSELVVNIFIERKPRYVIINVILPIIFMAYLSNVVFVIPADCGERISYSITVLLAIAVYLSIVGDNLPKTSFPMSYFSYYLLALLVTSICITLATIFNLRIYHSTASDPVSGSWTKIATYLNCRRNKRKEKKIKNSHLKKDHQNRYSYRKCINHIISEEVYELPPYLFTYEPQEQPVGDIRQIKTFKKNKRTKPINKHESDKTVTWKDVSLALDKMFSVMFFFVQTVATIAYVVIIAVERKQI